MAVRINRHKFLELAQKEEPFNPQKQETTPLCLAVATYLKGQEAFDQLPFETLLDVLHSEKEELEDAAMMICSAPDQIMRDRLNKVKQIKIRHKKRF